MDGGDEKNAFNIENTSTELECLDENLTSKTQKDEEVCNNKKKAGANDVENQEIIIEYPYNTLKTCALGFVTIIATIISLIIICIACLIIGLVIGFIVSFIMWLFYISIVSVNSDLELDSFNPITGITSLVFASLGLVFGPCIVGVCALLGNFDS